MIQVTCERSGLLFESDSKKKVHPGIKALLEGAYDNGKGRWYAATGRAIAEGRAQGLATLADFEQFVAEQVECEQAEASEAAEIRAEEREQRAAYWAAVKAENALLRAGGFYWLGADEEFAIVGPDGKEWSRGAALAKCGHAGSVQDAPFRPGHRDHEQTADFD